MPIDQKRNSRYWLPKLERNIARDRDTDEMLRGAGWTVVRVWEHEDPAEAAGEIKKIVESRRRRYNADG